jgi:hypothetical protein
MKNSATGPNLKLFLSDAKAADKEAVDAVLQEHMSFRRRKSMIVDPTKGEFFSK